MNDKSPKDEEQVTETPEVVEAVTPVEEPTAQTDSVKQTYFFPPDFSCEAANLEEATKIYNDFKKGHA